MNAVEKMKKALINEKPDNIEAVTKLTLSEIQSLRFRSFDIHKIGDNDKIWLLNRYYSIRPEELEEDVQE
ncbi:hypothetical protein FCS83_04525 [Oenococcus sp. UCMA 17063]|nr:hypothetical protein [Oenococcus sp. UCMA 17063]